MPRLPVDGKKVIEHRISLGGVEREALRSLALSYRLESLAGDDGVLKQLSSLDDVIATLAVVGFILEVLGITDILDFDDAAKAKAMEIKEKIGGNFKDAVVRNELEGVGINQILGFLNQLLQG